MYPIMSIHGKSVGIKGNRNVYQLSPGGEKSNLTFVGNISADGNMICPAIIYPYIRLPRDIAETVPENFFIGQSESEWMTSAIFFKYIANAFIPWLIKEIRKPIILLVDGHSHTFLSRYQLFAKVIT